MTSDGSRNTIAPELFEYVTEYAQELRDGDSNVYETVDGDHALVVFAENFIEQFSSGYLKQSISGFNARSKRQLRECRRALERKRLRKNENTEAAQHLVFHLEPLCDLVPEISYGNSEIDTEEFHGFYMVGLLERIVAWLDELPSASSHLRDVARDAHQQYVSSME